MKRVLSLLEMPKFLKDKLSAIENRLKDKLSAIENRLTALEVKVSSPQEREAATRATALLAAGWSAQSNISKESQSLGQDGELAVIGPSVSEAKQKLSALKPEVFPTWERLHQNDEASYSGEIEHSCSHWDHKYARLFGAFVSLFAHGRLLDIGCGTVGRPAYLAHYPSRLISGLDPRPSQVAVDFQYVQGFNEFLPWKDETFRIAVSGTSLDHVLSLERSLEEVRRVLKPGGAYLVWLASIPGSKPYEPDADDFEPADQFHLFHFDRKWIEPIFAKYFSIEEVCVIWQPGFDHVFYRLVKRPT